MTAYPLASDGTVPTAAGGAGTPLGSTTTDATGAFSLALPSTPVGAVLVTAEGGAYVSPWDGVPVASGTGRTQILVETLETPEGVAGAGNLVVSPLSALVSARARALLAQGSSLPAAHQAALDLIRAFYGFQGAAGTVLEHTPPTFDAASIGTDPFLLGFVLGGLEALASRVSPADREALFDVLAQDASDAVFDGKGTGGGPLLLEGAPMPFTAGTSDFLSALTSYAGSGKSNTDRGISPAELAGPLATVRSAVPFSPATPSAVGLSAGSSGAMASMSFGGKQWLFVAARTKGVVAIDITDPEADAPEIKVWSSLYSTTFHAPVGGVIALAGADHPQLLVYAFTGSKHWALVHAETGVVEDEGDLPLVAPSPVGFSGGSAYVAGGIPDTGRDGVWLATADGYWLFDRSTHSLLPSEGYPVDASQRLSENVGGDVAHGILWAPNYGAVGGPLGGIQLVDLGARKSYSMDDAQFGSVFRSQGMYMPDAGAVDTAYRVGILTEEDSPDVGFVNLATVTETDGDGGPGPTGLNRFTCAADGTAHLKLGTIRPILSGSAVDSTTHLVFFMAGVGTDVAVGELQDPNAVPAAETWSGLEDWRFVAPLPGISLAGDPHSVAVALNNSNHRAYGYLLDGMFPTAVHQIDLRALLDASPVGATGDDAHRVATDLQAANIQRIRAFP